jgi:hypothetical protein
MELDWEGKRSNALKLRRSQQGAHVFAAREELAPATQFRAERMPDQLSPAALSPGGCVSGGCTAAGGRSAAAAKLNEGCGAGAQA